MFHFDDIYNVREQTLTTAALECNVMYKYEVFEYVAGRHAVFLDFLLCAACIDIIDDGHLVAMLRSYHHESTRSHQNSEVKRGWARLVLG